MGKELIPSAAKSAPEITPEMLVAGADKLDLVTVENLWEGTERPDDVVKEIFCAMLRASPANP